MCTKRWIAAVLAAALAVMMLAGCDGSSSSSSSSDSGNSSSGGNNSSSSSSDNGNGNSGGSSSSDSSGIFDSTDGKLNVNEVNRMLKAAKSEITCASSTEVDQFVNEFADKVKETKEADFSLTMFQDELNQGAEAKWGNDKRSSVAILAALGYQMMGYSTIERFAVETILQWESGGLITPMPEKFDVGGYKVHTQGGPQYWIFCLTWADASNAPDAGS